ncbi:biotin-dependent carboxyltransferase family protein [Anaeroselena agilis]|uniref:Biotin-dependent carboxyltransferase family protein n=1 Tax=Anaeroselena agilis TaxID=3063788 RepID=A0ABU3NW02_9FIRM|nr:biotin-dependent carboxyltransferase family protein [Selenomonadales bacterium 4137-cl]
MITIVSAGLFTTVQDAGRWGFQAYGVPVAGAMDRYAYNLANILAGNPPGTACLEMTVTGDTIRFETDAYIAICGADMQPALDGKAAATWSAFPVTAGSTLSCGYAVRGCRTYLAVRGGIDVPVVLGSRSTYTRAAIGGLEGRKLKVGDKLAIGNSGPSDSRPLHLPGEYKPAAVSGEITLRVLPGPQQDHFTMAGIETLFSSPYTITDEADRMGCRLEGLKIEHADKADIVSDALPQGAIQVPGHGMPIIMMADRQTTGGYTKIGTVIGPDLALLAQAKPGDTVRLKRCSDEEAVAVLRKERELYEAASAWRASALSREQGPVRRFTMTVNGQSYDIEVREV